MCTIAIEALTPLDRTLCIKMYKTNARSRLFCLIAKRSIELRQGSKGFVSGFIYIYIYIVKIFFPNLAILDIVKIMYSRP